MFKVENDDIYDEIAILNHQPKVQKNNEEFNWLDIQIVAIFKFTS